MKKILIPTDFSECAKNASAVALKLAKNAQASVHYVHIIEAPVDWKKLPKEKESNFPETLKAIGTAKSELGKLIRNAKKNGVKAQQDIVFNKPAVEIITSAKRSKADFIVMGTHGTSGATELFLGSNTQRIIRSSKVPVLAVKSKKSRFEIKTIVIASTFAKKSEKGLTRIVDFAKLVGARPHLLYVNTPANFQETSKTTENILRYKSHCPNGTSWSIENALNVERGILNYTSYNKADMIAIITEGRSGILRLLNKSVAEATANHSDIPVLTVPI